ncbi:sulfate transporter [Burkholderia pyrrocinia]|nr:sulfate transporter [Burkholderia pyrrocinia]
MENEQIPSGYWKDAKGCLIPESMIKPIDRERDRLVRDLVDQAKVKSKALAELKARIFGDIAAFVDLSAEEYQTKRGGTKGNVTLYSFDGRYRIQRAIQDHIAFDERLQAAKSMIDECLHDWTTDARPEIQAIVTQAFATDKEGQINTGRVLALRRLNIADARWQQAMSAIGEALQVIGSKSYVRIYERVGDTDQYKQIPLDITSA